MSPSFFTILSPSENNIYILKLKKKINDIILQNEIIFSYKDNDEIINFKSPLTGVIKTLSDPEISPGQTVATIIPGCPHPSLLKNICVVCGEEVSDLFDNKYIPLLHKNPEITVKEEHAITLSRADEQRLLNEKRLVLIVDLDHTLIHTTNENLPSNLKDVYHYILHNNQAIWYHTKLRPGTFRFLQNMNEFFELHICTFGVRAYAHAIADIIDKEGKYFSHRILSRDEFFDPTSKTPNLKCLFPVNDAMVCIIDDREDVWNYTENLIHVKPYRFFDNGDINSPDLIAQMEINQNDTDKNYIDESVEDNEIEIIDEKGGTGDIKLLIDQVVDQIDHVVTKKIDTEIVWPDHDDYLYYLEDILKRVHKQFFDKLAYNVMAYKNSPNAESKKMPSLKQIIPDIKKSVLSGSSIAFSGVFPKTIPLLQSKERRMALSLGAKVTADIIPNVTTHLIAAIKGTNKVHKARKLGIHVVTIDWLISCYERWEHTGEKLFPLPATAKENVRISSTTKSIKTKSITSKKNIDSNISFVPWKKLIAIDFDDGFKVKSHHSKTMHVSREDEKVLESVCKPGKTLPYSTLTRTKSLKNTTNYYYDKVTGKKVKRFNNDGDDDVFVLYDNNHNNGSDDKTISSQCNSSTKNPDKSVVDLSGKSMDSKLFLKSNDSVMQDAIHSQEDESSLSHNLLKTMEQEIIDAINDEDNSDMESSESCGTDKEIIENTTGNLTKEDTNSEFTTTPNGKRKEASS